MLNKTLPDAVKTIIIGGVTASGKSTLAQCIAQKYNSLIINADSKQVYKGVSITTAQPRHFVNDALYAMYSYIDLASEYSVSRWKSDADLLVGKALHYNKVPILLGGSGMYISCFINGLAEMPSISQGTKTIIAEKIHTLSRSDFREHYLRLDPNIAKININDTYRLTRMAEVLEETGKSLLDFYQSSQKNASSNSYKLYLIIPDKRYTERSVQARLDEMLQIGMIEEVIALKQSGLAEAKMARSIYGVIEISDYLDSKITLVEAKKIILHKTMQYAKRQRTWFKNQYKDAIMFDDIDKAQCVICNEL